MNPYEAILADLRQQVANLQARINDVQRQVSYHYGKEQEQASQGNYGAAYQAASAAYNQALLQRQRLEAELAGLLSALADAEQKADAIANAAAQAVAQGLTPEAAMAKALADQERAEGLRNVLTYAGIGLLILLVVWAVIAWRRSRK